MTKNNIYIIIAAFGGILIGAFFFGNFNTDTTEANSTKETLAKKTIWTCAMHPQIRQHEPGKCPICSMDLTPLDESNSTEEQNTNGIQLSENALKMANVQTSIVRVGSVENTTGLHLNGKVTIDERSITKIPAHFHGRVEKLNINFTGERIQKGQLLATIYSPDLIAAQEELLQAIKVKDSNPALYKAARKKLTYWKLADQEIERIENTGEILTQMNIHTHHSGVVLMRKVAQGDHVKMGDILFEIADLSKVWVLFDAYEKDLPFIRKGTEIAFSIPAFPKKVFKTKVTFIDPVINAKTRVAKVRAEVKNEAGELKPEMFVKGDILSNTDQISEQLVIPQSAVLWTGKRSVVYVKKPNTETPTFEFRQVTIGQRIGTDYIIEEGLSEGEEIVTKGTFTIDAAAQLNGKVSMMNPESKAKKPMIHHHHLEENHPKKQARTPDSNQDKLDLSHLLSQYIELKNALVADELETAKKATNSLIKITEKLGIKDEFNAFNSQLSTQSIALKREAFEALSAELIKLLEKYGTGSENIYYIDYCPMANDNLGAHWVSEIETIRNPYFGEMMMGCGSVKKVLKK